MVVGNTAAAFGIDWREALDDPVATVDEVRAFVADYEAARGRAFSGDELELVDAANLAMLAYTARCQHSDLVLHNGLGGSTEVGFLRLLRQRGPRLL